MKVKLYELLEMIANNQIKIGEKLIINKILFTYEKVKGYPYFFENVDKRSLDWYIDVRFNLNKECELIDRKEANLKVSENGATETKFDLVKLFKQMSKEEVVEIYNIIESAICEGVVETGEEEPNEFSDKFVVRMLKD